MENMPDGSQIVAVPKIGFKQVARRSVQTVSDAMLLSNLFGHLQNFRPVDRIDLDLRRLLGQRDAPYSRAGTNVQDRSWPNQFGNLQVFAQDLGRAITHGEDSLDEFSKEFGSRALLVY